MPRDAAAPQEGAMIMASLVWSKCLPIAVWPQADRAAWDAAMRPGDPFERAGIASKWSAATLRKTARGYGRFLCWLKQHNELDESAGPNDRVTRERLIGYLDELKKTNRGHTIQCRIQELGDAMRALVPEGSWGFINRAAGRLRANTIPVRQKRGRMPRIVDVIVQGYSMMDEAEGTTTLSELGRAALHRDGLLLVFLCYHPLRLLNLSSLRIGHHLLAEGESLILNVDATETKGRRPIQQEISPRLSCAVKRYIERYRPVLLRARGRWYTPATDELWISHDGSPCSAETFQNIIRNHVTGPNGQPFSPHLFRSLAATSISIEAPGSVDLIPAILNHGSHRTGEQYYNLASSLDASRAFNSALDTIRKTLESAEQEDKPQ
jgi:integrase/recombinase XerD